MLKVCKKSTFEKDILCKFNKLKKENMAKDNKIIINFVSN